MIRISGKDVFTELDELVEPAHTALLLVDMQRDFVEPDGAFGSLGVDLSMYVRMRPVLQKLTCAARSAGVLIIHIQNTTLPERMSDSPAQIRFNLRMHEQARAGGPPLQYTVRGTAGHEIIEELTPQSGELVVPKHRSSAFWGTDLELLLRSNGIKTVVMTGCTTEGCVESTARDAMFTDHYVVIAEDCVASDDLAQHNASMLLMEHRFDMALSATISNIWASSRGENDGLSRRSSGQAADVT